MKRFKQLILSKVSTILILLLVIATSGNAQVQKSTKSVESLSDYSFIGTGYGALSAPSMPAPGVYVPYIPDLSNLDESKVVVVSNGSELKSAIGSNKIIVCNNGEYNVQISSSSLTNLVIISKNKWGAKFTGGGPKFAFSKMGVHEVSIIGFEAVGTGESNSDGNAFIKAVGSPANNSTSYIYIRHEIS
jgi:hypothetical protein